MKRLIALALTLFALASAPVAVRRRRRLPPPARTTHDDDHDAVSWSARHRSRCAASHQLAELPLAKLAAGARTSHRSAARRRDESKSVSASSTRLSGPESPRPGGLLATSTYSSARTRQSASLCSRLSDARVQDLSQKVQDWLARQDGLRRTSSLEATAILLRPAAGGSRQADPAVGANADVLLRSGMRPPRRPGLSTSRIQH